MSESSGYYCDPKTGERVKATFQIHFVMRATHAEFVEVEAYSEQEAVQLALYENDWTYRQDWFFEKGDVHGMPCAENDRGFIEVEEINCEHPPEGAYFIPARSSEADISAEFEEVSEAQKDLSLDSATGGDSCK